MLPILASYVAISIAGEPALAVGFAGGVLAMNGTNFTGLLNGRWMAFPVVSWLPCWLALWPVM